MTPTERWTSWQREHSEALGALQEAQRAYHRTIAEGAFASRTADPAAVALRHASLMTLEVARARLDQVRSRQPPREMAP